MDKAKELDLNYPESYKLFQQNDWQTALSIAALKKKYCNVATELKIHGPHTAVRPLHKLDEHGFNTKTIHEDLFYDNGYPTKDHVTNMYNRNVDFLTSGILKADKIDLVGYHIRDDILNWRLKDLKDIHGNNFKVMSEKMTQMFIDRYYETIDHHTVGTVPNEPSRHANPSINPHLEHKYGTEDIMEGKAINKAKFQQEMGLNVDSSAPILYWPHRLSDPQKGTRLFMNSIDDLMNTYKDDKLQIAFVADGEFEFTNWARVLQDKYKGRIAIKSFTNTLSELGKAGSDFIMMPSLFEPRGLPQLEGPIYGTLPIVSKYVDGIISYDKNPDMGNGWIFENYDHGGIKWAVGEAIKFFKQPYELKKRHLQNIREYQLKEHNVDKMIDSQIESWTDVLDRQGQKLILRAV
jgi:glycogen synthase